MNWKRMISLVITLILLIEMVPINTLALETENVEEIPIEEVIEEEAFEVIEAVPEESLEQTESEVGSVSDKVIPEEIVETPEKMVSTEDTIPPVETRSEEIVDSDSGIPSVSNIAEGVCGENLIWVLDQEGLLTISGQGDMENYHISADEMDTTVLPAWYEYREQIKSVVIEENITSVGTYAFADCIVLETIEFGSQVCVIGEQAFYGCDALTVLTFSGKNVPIVESDLFADMTTLTEIWVPTEAYDSYTSAYGSIIPANAALEAEGIVAVSATNNASSTVMMSSANTEITATDTESVSKTTAEESNTEPISTIVASGICGEDLTWQLDDTGMLAISGTGNMESFKAVSDTPWYSYRSQIKTLRIHEGVTSIGAYAFSGFTELTGELVFPDSIVSIESSAFKSCNGLTGTLVIPDGVIIIGSSAFQECTSLTGIYLGANVSTIEMYAFYRCYNLDGILELPDSVTTIDMAAFCQCTRLDTLILGNSLTHIGQMAFYDCSGLTGEIKIPDTLTELGDRVFWANKGITSVVIGSGITTIGKNSSISQNPFYNCENMETVTFLSNIPPVLNSNMFSSMEALKTVWVPLESYDEYVTAYIDLLPLGATIQTDDKDIKSGTCGKTLFWEWDDAGTLTISGFGEMEHYPAGSPTPWAEYKDEITTLIIQEGVTSIGACAFSDCTALGGKLVFPDSLTSISSSAFENCTGLLSLQFGSNLTSIGADAFQGCKGLAGKLMIPDSVSIIDWMAFESCTGLTELILGDGMTAIGNYAFMNCTSLANLDLGNSVNSIGAYAFLACTNLEGELVIPDSVTEIKEGAFNSCSNLTSIKLGNGLFYIGGESFANLTGLKGELIIPDSVTTIGNSAFGACSNLTSLILGRNLTSIGDYAFSNCTGLSCKLVIPDNVTTIGKYAFRNCQSLEELQLGNSLATIDQYAFYNCSGLSGKLTISDSVTAIGSFAFNGCNNLSELQLGDSLISIGSSAFASLTGLSGRLVIPDSVESIGSAAFSNCSGLTELQLGEGLVSIKDSAFRNCSGLSGTLTIPGSVNTIGNYAFDGTNLSGELILSDNISALGYGAFQNCTKLTGVQLGNGITSIKERTFYNCSGLTGTVVFSANIKAIEKEAFYKCQNITTMYFNSSTPPTFGDNAFAGMNGLKTIYIPEYSCIEYMSALDGRIPAFCRVKVENPSQEFIVEDGILVLYCGDETDVVIPADVVSIGSNAFRNCSTIVTITIPKAVTNIGNYSFYGCSNLCGELIIPDSVESIGDYAFYRCVKISGVKLGCNLSHIGNNVFHNCTALTDITFTGTMPPSENGKSIFLLSALETMWVPATSFDDYVLAYSSLILYETEIKAIDNSVVGGECGSNLVWKLDNTGKITISGTGNMSDYTEDSAPWNKYKDQITELVIHDGVLSIGQCAFYNYPNIVGDIIIPDSVTEVGNAAFFNCSGFTGLKLGSGVNKIISYAFYKCIGLNGVVILPNSVKSIGRGAFRDSNIEMIVFKGDSPSFDGGSAANDCFKSLIANVYYPANNESWTSNVMQHYGGTITWIPYIEHEILEGEATTVVAGNPLVVRANAEVSTFKNVTVDGEIVDPANYSVTEGSTIVTFTAEYLETLSEGDHSAILHFTDGGMSFATISVEGSKSIPVTITANDISIAAGEVPNLTYTMTGSENVDFNPILKVVDEKGSEIADFSIPGSYSIVIDSYEIIPGYVVTAISGTLTVKPSEIIPEFAFKPMGGYLTLKNEVFLTVYYTFTNQDELDIEKVKERAGLLVWNADEAPEEADAIYENCDNPVSNTTYLSSLSRFETKLPGIPAKEMGDALAFRPYYQLDDGSYVYGRYITSYSPKTYCYNKLNDSDVSDDALMVAILNYGAAAQNALNYRTDDLMNANLTDAQKALDWDGSLVRSNWNVPTEKTGELTKNVNITTRGGYLTLKGAIDYAYYAMLDTSIDIEKAEIFYWTESDYNAADVLTLENATTSEEMTYVEYSDGKKRYEAVYEGLPARYMFSPVYACAVFTDTDGNVYYGGAVAYCPERYGYMNQNSADTNTATMAKRMVIYGDAARSYFGQE